MNYISFEKGNDLNPIGRDLLEQAVAAAERAYAPYSKFYVGAALLLENGKIVLGCNQENASYPCGICAERTALYSKGVQFKDIKILKLAVTVITPKEGLSNPAAPCGICRQVMQEFEYNNNGPIELILGHPKNLTWVFKSVSELLPMAFNPSVLLEK